ncbi:DASS family sodium-coupled anion symporter [Rubrobacter taiwanensis]|uniref:Sodium-dependent dicarboxylate transporter SdcS n=1 Tax=Rubrobacter taiwanensis TaxID=185139 RepID=A0A4R1BE22_9ACTN|nr:DASS family sodium-coupled anion symporter [Rubrobacter taiwanensis]TCJ15248.1 DASS family sodium-coupled anion symporter [Rubrobacter taiwanensis]
MSEERELADVPERGEAVEKERISVRAWVGRFLGPVLAVLAYFTLPTGPEALTPEGVAVVSVGILMAVWWITEALPLPATALLPIALLPLFGAVEIAEATAPYASDVIFLFMGGFMIALAMQRWGLHRRIALLTVLAVGTNPVRLIGGFMIATGFLSMWVSNTATTLVMLPIGLSVLALVFNARGAGEAEALTGRGASNFATCLMLAIAYAASIGSLSTLIGTPPNLFMAGFLEETYDISIGFGQWMLVGLPLSVVFLSITWVVLTRFVYPPEIDEISGGRELIRGQLDEMGPVSRGEKVVLTVFALTAFAWVFREPLASWDALVSAAPFIGGLSDAGIAIIAAVALFAIPVDWRGGVFALDWRTVVGGLPWGVLLLFGGGLSLASAIVETGVDEWIGTQVAGLGGLPVLLLVVISAGAILLLTELTSNTATAATFLPILAGAAIGLNLDPLLLVIPAALAASCAFMMPVATPPNAIVFGSGHVTIVQMVRAGVWLNILAVILITLTVYTLGAFALGMSL